MADPRVTRRELLAAAAAAGVACAWPWDEAEAQGFLANLAPEEPVEATLKRLEEAGFSTWRDTEKLRAGDDWRAEIDQAIISASALVAVMTPAAAASPPGTPPRPAKVKLFSVHHPVKGVNGDKLFAPVGWRSCPTWC